MSTATVRRVQYHRYGGPDMMRLEAFEPPPPGPGEVRVRVRAAAANPMDWKIRHGDLAMVTGRTFPRGFGTDFSGVVEAVGPGARFRVGDEVLGGTSRRPQVVRRRHRHGERHGAGAQTGEPHVRARRGPPDRRHHRLPGDRRPE